MSLYEETKEILGKYLQEKSAAVGADRFHKYFENWLPELLPNNEYLSMVEDTLADVNKALGNLETESDITSLAMTEYLILKSKYIVQTTDYGDSEGKVRGDWMDKTIDAVDLFSEAFSDLDSGTSDEYTARKIYSRGREEMINELEEAHRNSPDIVPEDKLEDMKKFLYAWSGTGWLEEINSE